MAAPETEKSAFKNWFDRDAAKRLATQINQVHPGFNVAGFTRNASKGLDALELHARVRQFSDVLREALPRDTRKALTILVDSLPEPQTSCDELTDGSLQWPISQYIADHGLDYFETSMAAMEELTKRFTSEFAVRPFFERYPEATVAGLLKRTASPNPHVRRWCSEGIRPRLPWGKQLKALVQDPTPILPILHALKDDPELYVRRSVANNLNDIAKDHPELVLKICRGWNHAAAPNRKWLVKHALRSLIKDGNPEALAVLGFETPRQIQSSLSLTPATIAIGQSVNLQATLVSNSGQNQKLALDYLVDYVRKNGRRGTKVFKWKTLDLAAGASADLHKRHSMRLTTIRALYPGDHRITLQVNGRKMASSSFELTSA